jgi:Protein of unknown function (DUF732)
MRVGGVIAGVLAVCGAVALSGPAHADQYDFISALDSAGVSYESMLDMIDIGKELCHDLRSGATPPVGCHQTWRKLPRTSARILMRALDSGSAAVRVWLSASIFTMR